MAAPVWQSKGTDLTGTSSNQAVVALPASLAAGDIVVVALYKENAQAVTKPSIDWVEVTTGGMPISTTAPQTCHAFWFRCAGGEIGTVTFSWTTAVWRAASASRVTGAAASGDVIEAVNAAFNNSSASTSPSVALPAGSGADCLLFWIGTNWTGGNAWAAAGPSFTERTDIDVLAVDTRTNVGGGATGSVTATSGISGPQTAVLFSITSASAAAANDAGLWAPASTGIILPQSALYFPFTTSWASQDVGVTEQLADAALTGTGSLSASMASTKSVDASLSGTGTLTADATTAVFKAIDAALSATGTLTATASVSKPVAGTLTGTGTLAASETAAKSVDASLSGAGSLSASLSVSKPVSGSLSGTGSLSAAETAAKTVDGSLSGTGTLTATLATGVIATLAGTGTLSTAATRAASASGALSGTGTLNAAGAGTKPISGSLAGAGTLTAQVVVSHSITGSLAGTGSLVATADTQGLVTLRPDLGSTSRPNSGSTLRPDTGNTSRPGSGNTLRPDNGTTNRP